ncbi:MAG: DNA mismatch repair protein MutH, partial [Enterobacterales bacterium]
MSIISAPENTEQLLQRVQTIAGMNLASLAQSLNIQVPEDLRREKGWVGQLLEKVLGATAGNKPEPDFVGLGIELKTLPIDARGFPSESTYVCV